MFCPYPWPCLRNPWRCRTSKHAAWVHLLRAVWIQLWFVVTPVDNGITQKSKLKDRFSKRANIEQSIGKSRTLRASVSVFWRPNMIKVAWNLSGIDCPGALENDKSQVPDKFRFGPSLRSCKGLRMSRLYRTESDLYHTYRWADSAIQCYTYIILLSVIHSCTEPLWSLSSNVCVSPTKPPSSYSTPWDLRNGSLAVSEEKCGYKSRCPPSESWAVQVQAFRRGSLIC